MPSIQIQQWGKQWSRIQTLERTHLLSHCTMTEWLGRKTPGMVSHTSLVYKEKNTTHITHPEHVLHKHNTYYTTRTCITQPEHVWHKHDTYYTTRTCITQPEHVWHKHDTYYTTRTCITQPEHVWHKHDTYYTTRTYITQTQHILHSQNMYCYNQSIWSTSD